jgi:hypothetical protein
MSTLAQMWQPLAVADGATVHWRLGPCDLWLRRSGPEWRLAIRSGDDDASTRPPSIDAEPPPADIQWLRRIVPEGAASVSVVPRLPDRPVISRPDHPLSLLPGAQCRFFIGIPAFLSLRLDLRGIEMHETPTVALSKTWAGSVMAGELCYALHTTAKRDPGTLLPAAHRIVCPANVHNESPETLTFSRIALPVGALNVYQGDTRLWANAVTATYLGDEQWSRIRQEDTPPPFDQARDLLGQARNPAEQGSFLPLFSELKLMAHL